MCYKCKKIVDGYHLVYTYITCEECFPKFAEMLQDLESKAEGRAIELFFQPERSKREDLDCNCNDLEYLHNRYENYIAEYDDKCAAIIERLLKKSKMRCSEHCGNTVRDK